MTKRDKDSSVKSSIHRIVKNVKDHSVAEVGLWSTLIPLLDARNYDIAGHNRPEDFNDIANMSHPKKYIGIIYADGDSMGKELERLQSGADFKQFSEAVDNSIYEAVAGAISKHLPSKSDKTWPFDILLLGGDDLVMVTPADKVLEVGLTVMEQFTEFTRAKLGRALKLSVGIAIAHANYPFGQLLSLAESTLKFAKKEGAKRRQVGKTWEGGLLNFVVVSSANHLEFGEFYDDTLVAYADEGNKATNKPKNLHRTLRPYNAADFRELLNIRRNQTIAGIPRGKLKQLQQSIFQSQKQAMIDGLTLLFHWRNNKQREAIQKVVEEFARRNQNGQVHGLLFPWYQVGVKSNPKYYTPLLDLIEIFDFVAPSHQEEFNE